MTRIIVCNPHYGAGLTEYRSESSAQLKNCGVCGTTSCPSQFVELAVGVGAGGTVVGVMYNVLEDVVTGRETEHLAWSLFHWSRR